MLERGASRRVGKLAVRDLATSPSIDRRLTLQTLKGKHAVVTGGGRGIGAAIAAALAERGATLTLMGRDQTRLKAQAEMLPNAGPVHTFAVDVANADSVTAAFAWAEAAGGPVHILVN